MGMGKAEAKALKAEQLAACWKALTAGTTLESHCSGLFLSKALSMVVILGGMAFKVPQIMKIKKNKSAAGVSISQFMLEMCVAAITLTFNFHIGAPVTTYAESGFILAQNVVIVFQIRHYQNIAWGTFILGLIAYIGLLAFMYSPVARDLEVMMPMCSGTDVSTCGLQQMKFQACLQGISTIVMISSRIPQIMTNFKTQDCSNLSIVTWGLNFMGASIRVFTTFKELPDELVLQAQFVISAALSGIVILQILMFGGKKAEKKKAA